MKDSTNQQKTLWATEPKAPQSDPVNFNRRQQPEGQRLHASRNGTGDGRSLFAFHA